MSTQEWKDSKAARITEYEAEISALTDNIVLQKLAAKGATRILDEVWNDAASKDLVKTKADLYAWDEIAKKAPTLGNGRSGNTLAVQARAIINRAVREDKDVEAILEAVVPPTRKGIKKALELLEKD